MCTCSWGSFSSRPSSAGSKSGGAGLGGLPSSSQCQSRTYPFSEPSSASWEPLSRSVGPQRSRSFSSAGHTFCTSFFSPEVVCQRSSLATVSDYVCPMDSCCFLVHRPGPGPALRVLSDSEVGGLRLCVLWYLCRDGEGKARMDGNLHSRCCPVQSHLTNPSPPRSMATH